MVYVLVGVVALLSLMQVVDGGADEDSIIESFKNIPLGEIFIWLIIGGMFGYISWRIFEALTDPYRYGKSFRGIVKRTGIVLSALAYLVIAFSGIQVLLGLGSEDSGQKEQQLIIAKVFEWNGGEFLVGGVIIGFTGLMEFKYVITGAYDPRMATENLSILKQRVINFLAWIGHFSRGILLLIISYTFILAAIQSDPKEAVNTDKAFNFIGEGIFGHPLFVIIAIGTICYGLFMFTLGFFYQFKREI